MERSRALLLALVGTAACIGVAVLAVVYFPVDVTLHIDNGTELDARVVADDGQPTIVPPHGHAAIVVRTGKHTLTATETDGRRVIDQTEFVAERAELFTGHAYVFNVAGELRYGTPDPIGYDAHVFRLPEGKPFLAGKGVYHRPPHADRPCCAGVKP